MNWAYAIERNRAALLAVVAAVAALIGGRDGATPVARRLRNAALALLRPAEAAARRLIVIAARGIAVPPAIARPPMAIVAAAVRQAPREEAVGPRIPAFPLFDRPKRFGPTLRPAQPLGQPRIRLFWNGPSIPTAAAPPPATFRQAADPDAPVDASRLGLRLLSLERALADLSGQARRLARRMARRQACAASPGGVAIRSPLRLGRPPGHRRKAIHDVDHVLRECHALACDALACDALRPDTS